MAVIPRHPRRQAVNSRGVGERTCQDRSENKVVHSYRPQRYGVSLNPTIPPPTPPHHPPRPALHLNPSAQSLRLPV